MLVLLSQLLVTTHSTHQVFTNMDTDVTQRNTGMEIERMINASGPTGGHVVKPSDGKEPERVAFIHCVGSRDEQMVNHIVPEYVVCTP